MTQHRSLIATAVSLFLLIFATVGMMAQQETRANLGGRVTDPLGAALPNTDVIVTSQSTQVSLTVQTNQSGEWIVRYLTPGFYRVEVRAPGFKTAVHASIELQVADQKYIDTKLQVGAVSQSVTVESTTPLIDTSSAVNGTVVTNTELQELPTQSNAPTMMVSLTPGVIISGGVGGTGIFLWSNGGLSGTVVGGAGSGSSALNYAVDGGNVSNNAGNLAFEPPMDAVSEFRVVTNAYDASVGRQASATINVSMRGGTDSLHGDLYEEYQNNFANANLTQNKVTKTPVAKVRVNNYGGGAGGPVWIPKLYSGRNKKTFWYYTFSGIRNIQPASTGTMSIPTMAERGGDFSNSFTTTTVNGVTTQYKYQIYDPSTWNYDGLGDRQQFTCNSVANVICSTKLDKIASTLLTTAYMPPPDNTGDGASSDSNNYVKREQQNDKFAGNTLRVDQTWNNNNRSYVTLRENNWTELSYDPFGPGNLLQGLYQARSNKGMTLDHAITLRENLLADLRYNVTHWEGSSYDPSAGVNPASVGFPSSYAALMQDPSIPAFTGIVSGAENGGLGTTQADTYTNDTNQTFDISITQTHKNHTLRYGWEYMIQQQGTGNLGASGGNFSFGTNWTTLNPDATAGTAVGNDIASMLLGLPTSGSIPHNATAFYSQHYQAYYFHDDWRYNSKLTLNFGLRWDYERPPVERFNHMISRYDPSVEISPVTGYAQPLYQSQILGGSSSSNAGIALLQQYRPAASSFDVHGGYRYANVGGWSRSTVETRYKYVQPRIGFAYQWNPTLVIRGGLGRFVQNDFYTGSQSGYSQSTTFVPTTNNYHTINASWDNPFSGGLTPVTGNALGILTNVGSASSFTDPSKGRVYTDTASLTVQKQIKDYLIEIGGVVNLTRGLSVTDPLNSSYTGYNVNLPSAAAWTAAYTPTFSSNWQPSSTLPGNVQVPNPFYGSPNITSGFVTAQKIAAYYLLNPNPAASSGYILEDMGKGKETYYALNTKFERRFHNGFSIIQAFTWSKMISQTNFIGRQVYKQVIERRLDSSDHKFHYTLTPVYELPFGHDKLIGRNAGKLLQEAIGGFELTGQYNFLSGAPLVLPTNTNFYQGSDPSLGSRKNGKQWFDTSKFAPFPSASTTLTTLATYPSWTGWSNLPGASYTPASSTTTPQNGIYQDFATWNTYNQTTFGNIRNPYINNIDLGFRKNFDLSSKARFQFRMDTFNAFNHPRFGSIDVTPGDAKFGWFSGSSTWSDQNARRQLQFGGKILF